MASAAKCHVAKALHLESNEVSTIESEGLCEMSGPREVGLSSQAEMHGVFQTGEIETPDVSTCKLEYSENC